MKLSFAAPSLALTAIVLANVACSTEQPSEQVMLVDLPLHDPSPAALQAAWTKDCTGFGGYFRPDYVIALDLRADGQISLSASRNDTRAVGGAPPIETSSAEFATPDEAIRRTPKVIADVIEGEVQNACAYLHPDQSLRFRQVADLYLLTEKVGFRRVNLLVSEAWE